MDIIVMLLNWSATNPRLLELPVAVTRSKSSLLLTRRAAPLIMWKRCLSYNCEDNGKCGKAANDVVHPPAWQYVLVGLGIVICKCQIPLSQSGLSLTFFSFLLVIVAVMTGLWFMHRRWRNEKQVMLEQYYNEQIAYRQSIMSMSHAKQSLLSLPPNTTAGAARASLYGDTAWTSGTDYQSVPLPPNLRRDSTSGWSHDSDRVGHDSEVFLMQNGRYADAPEVSKYR